MRKTLFILLVMIGLVRCQVVDVLDFDPMYELDLEGAITTPDMAELALNGCYSYLPSTSINYLFTTTSGAFQAGAMLRASCVTSGNTIYYSERYLPTLTYSSFGDDEWECDYNVIKNVNYLLTALDGIAESDFEEGRKDEIIGECHFLQGLAYFRLLRQFGQYWDTTSTYGVLIRDELPAIANGEKARATVGESYAEIFRHLDIADSLAPQYSAPTQASVQASKALRAVAYFYQGDYGNALAAVNEAITSANPLAGSYLDVFTNAETCSEVIFCRAFGSDEESLMSYYPARAFSNGNWGPTDTYMDLIEGDARKDLVTSEVDFTYSDSTYRVRVASKMYPAGEAVPVIFMRTAELYLIKAECLARTGASISEAWAPVRELRLRGGNTDVTEPATQDELMDEIFREWWIEMAFENWHEWFAVQRFDRLLEMNETLAEDYQEELEAGESFADAFLQELGYHKIYNIPSGETEANPACVENPGY